MSSKTQNLSDFLKKYLSGKTLGEGAMSYSDYETLNPNLKKKDYLTALEKRYSNLARNRSNYGTSAENLAKGSLTSSGYSAFLERNAKSALDADVNEKYALYKTAEAENMTGYLNYLDNYQKQIKKLKTSVTDSLIKNKVVNKQDAYEYALEAGLSESDALTVSQNVYESAKRKLISEVMESVASYKLDAEGARLYAEAMGLSEKDAKGIGEYAEAIISNRIDTGDEYLDYLRELANKKYKK